MNKPSVGRGIVAGFVATIIMSIFILLKNKIGLRPEFDVIALILNVTGIRDVLTESRVIGWIIHFLVGSIFWGSLYSFVRRILPSSSFLSGVIYGISVWLVLMLVGLPMVGGGIFGWQMNLWVPFITLTFHLVYGITIGITYDKLEKV